MPYLNQGDCCGLREISGIARCSGPEKALENLAKGMLYDSSWRHAVFTQAGTRSTYGEKFKAYILKEKLGTVVESETKVNPNSGNKLKAYVWTVDWRRMKGWMKRHKIEREKSSYGIW